MRIGKTLRACLIEQGISDASDFASIEALFREHIAHYLDGLMSRSSIGMIADEILYVSLRSKKLKPSPRVFQMLMHASELPSISSPDHLAILHQTLQEYIEESPRASHGADIPHSCVPQLGL
ncbi:MAG: hypothetical protein Q7S76_01260 [bacterium]|nr:hypothetical protein [bacterium]